MLMFFEHFQSNPNSSLINKLKIQDTDYIFNLKYFVLCNSCFWCASQVKSNVLFMTCPLCGCAKIDCMPIAADEKYSLTYSDKNGIELEFSN